MWRTQSGLSEINKSAIRGHLTLVWGDKRQEMNLMTQLFSFMSNRVYFYLSNNFNTIILIKNDLAILQFWDTNKLLGLLNNLASRNRQIVKFGWIRSKNSVRWRYLFRMKVGSFCWVLRNFEKSKRSRLPSGTSTAIYSWSSPNSLVLSCDTMMAWSELTVYLIFNHEIDSIRHRLAELRLEPTPATQWNHKQAHPGTAALFSYWLEN